MPIRTSRRTFTAGAFATLSTVRAVASATLRGSGPPWPALRVGLLDPGSQHGREIARTALDPWSGPRDIVYFGSWGSLIDHLTAAAGGGIDAALLPSASLARLEKQDASFGRYWRMPIHPPGLWSQAALIVSPRMSALLSGGWRVDTPLARPLVVARATADPVADGRLLAVLRSLGLVGQTPMLIDLAPSAMPGNVASGRIDAALLTGPGLRGEADRHERAGMEVRRFDAATAALLCPRLVVVVRPGAPRSPL